MSTVEMIVKNEPLDDIVTVFALLQATPHLDMMIRRHNRDLIDEYGKHRTLGSSLPGFCWREKRA